MKVVWTPPALRTLEAIADHVSAHDEKAAQRLGKRIRTAVGRLSDRRYMGRRGQRPGTRELFIAGTRDLVVYEVTAEAVDIVAIFHTRQQRPTPIDPS